MKSNNLFEEDLAFSHRQEEQLWWELVYREAFPGFLSMISARSDMEMQRSGIDRLVSLRGGRVLFVDEKVRRKQWPDIAIEYKHVLADGSKRRGWIAKRLQTDFIAYAFFSSHTCYLLPFQTLQRVWKDNFSDWCLRVSSDAFPGFREVVARNPKNEDLLLKYHTHSIAIPIDNLLDHIKEALVIRWLPDGRRGEGAAP